MITLIELKRRAMKLAASYIEAWYAGNGAAMFPLQVRANLAPVGNRNDVAHWVRQLMEASKATRGFGYSLEMKQVNSRTYGQNLFPVSIYFETPNDLLAFAGVTAELEKTVKVADVVTTAFPELHAWIGRNLPSLPSLVPVVDGLVAVTQYMRSNPRPGVFAREFPVAVHSKFVEENERILREWLDQILPASSISADEDHFARRFGLRYIDQMAWVRLLDVSLLAELGLPHEVVGLTLDGLANLRIPADVRMVIVENKVNLLTLPAIPRALALGGMGNAVLQLARLGIMSNRPVVYWGDMDSHGYEILDRFRRTVFQATSILMDVTSLTKYADLAVTGPDSELRETKSLSTKERVAYELCVTNRWRVEQERIPHRDVILHFASLA